MNLPAFPRYPTPRRTRDHLGLQESRLSPRARRLARDVVLLAAIVGLLLALGHVTTAILQAPTSTPPRPRLDFALVVQRFDALKVGMSRESVHQLLGLPTQPETGSAVMEELETMARNSSSHIFRSPHIADLWTNPNDATRWVLVIFGDYKLHWMVKHGL